MKYNSDLCVIPRGCTSKLQPADVSWNKPFKSHLSEMYDEWLFSGPVEKIKVITKLPNSEQSYKGKVKTHNYINRQNQSTTGKL